MRKLSKLGLCIYIIIIQYILASLVNIGYANNSEAVSVAEKQLTYFQFNIALIIVMIVLVLFAMVIRILTNKELQEREITRREQLESEEKAEEYEIRQIRKEQSKKISGDELEDGTDEPKTTEQIELTYIPKSTKIDLERHREKPKQGIKEATSTQSVKTAKPIEIESSIDKAIRQSSTTNYKVSPISDDSDIIPLSESEINQIKTIDQQSDIKEEQSSVLDAVIQQYEGTQNINDNKLDDEVVPGSGSSAYSKQGVYEVDTTWMDEDDPFIDLEPDNPEQFFGYQMAWQFDIEASLAGKEIEESMGIQDEKTDNAEKESINDLQELSRNEVTEDSEVETDIDSKIEQIDTSESDNNTSEIVNQDENNNEEIKEAPDADTDITDTTEDSDKSTQNLNKNILKDAKTAQDIVKAFQSTRRKKNKNRRQR